MEWYLNQVYGSEAVASQQFHVGFLDRTGSFFLYSMRIVYDLSRKYVLFLRSTLLQSFILVSKMNHAFASSRIVLTSLLDAQVLLILIRLD